MVVITPRHAAIALALLVVTSLQAASPSLDVATLPEDPAARAEAIMNYIDDLWRGGSSEAVMSMNIRTEHWSRSLEMRAWSLGKDFSLVRILTPKKEAGSATLKSGTVIYNYLPKTDRTIKITSGMMMSSWMGSHFTNDDLVKESRYAEDYHAEVVFDGTRDGIAIWEIRLDPKPDAAVVWGKVIFLVRKQDLMPITASYFDEKGARVRTMRFSDYKEMSGRIIPSRVVLQPEDKPEEATELVYASIVFDAPISTEFFTLQNLR